MYSRHKVNNKVYVKCGLHNLFISITACLVIESFELCNFYACYYVYIHFIYLIE